MSSTGRVLVVVTSHGDIDGRPTTGIWFTEFSEPYAALLAAGVDGTVASPRAAPAPSTRAPTPVTSRSPRRATRSWR